VVTGRQRLVRLSGLQTTGRHFARLHVALHVVAKLLAFNDFAHTGALDGLNTDERIGAAIVTLNEAEAFCGLEPFYCACGHDEPFQSNLDRPRKRRLRGTSVAMF
jgi:hypothetical protein